MLASESEVCLTWLMQMKKSINFEFQYCFLPVYWSGQISLQAAFQMGGESKVDKILMS